MYPFSYDVVYYIEDYNRESGVSFCDNWRHAMQILENYYGDDLIEVKSLILYEENSTILLPRSVIKQYMEEPDTIFDNGSRYPCDKWGNAVSVEPVGKGEVNGIAELIPIESIPNEPIPIPMEEKWDNNLEIIDGYLEFPNYPLKVK